MKLYDEIPYDGSGEFTFPLVALAAVVIFCAAVIGVLLGVVQLLH